MRLLGHVLLWLGFLAGAYIAVLTEENRVEWIKFVPGVVVAMIGVAIARISAHRESHGAEAVGGNIQAIKDSLDRIVGNVSRLDDEKASINVYDLPDRIDTTFNDDLNIFVEARESIGHAHGLQAYADVMNSFATAERYLNRVWSCSVDGYIDEAHKYIGLSREQFGDARDKLGALEAGP